MTRLTYRGVKKLSNFCNYSYCKIGTRVIEVKTCCLQRFEWREHQPVIEAETFVFNGLSGENTSQRIEIAADGAPHFEVIIVTNSS